MITVKDIEQGTDEWLAMRAGIPTTSNFGKIITSTGKKSAQATGFMNDLLAEWVTGEKKSIKQTDWMLRGTELEPEARQAYEFITDNEVEQVTFCYRDDSRLVGCSPDGLIGGDGMVEFKCPSPGVHVGYLLGGKIPTDYVPQVQGQLWVTKREWCDFCSYHPDLKPMIIRVERDEKIQEAMDEIIPAFIETMLENRAKLQQRAA